MTTWKDRLWQLFLVITFGIVLSVCTSNSSTSKKSGLAYADYKPSDVTAVMFCTGRVTANSDGVGGFYNCDSSDSTSIGTVTIGSSNYSYGITWGDLVSAGFRPCGPGFGGSYGAHYFFCK